MFEVREMSYNPHLICVIVLYTVTYANFSEILHISRPYTYVLSADLILAEKSAVD